jgi:hypothetical protein
MPCSRWCATARSAACGSNSGATDGRRPPRTSRRAWDCRKGRRSRSSIDWSRSGWRSASR